MSPESNTRVARILLEIGAVRFSPQKPFTWASGIRSPVYTDNRLLLGYPAHRKIVADLLGQIARGLSADAVAGIPTAGVPWASFVAHGLNKPLLLVRKDAKDHGLGKKIEGKLEANQVVLLVEDLVSTGGSSLSGIEAIRAEGGRVLDCACIFSYDTKKAREAFGNAGVRLHPLAVVDDLLAQAEQSGLLTPADKPAIESFFEDPEHWGQKQGWSP